MKVEVYGGPDEQTRLPIKAHHPKYGFRDEWDDLCSLIRTYECLKKKLGFYGGLGTP